MPSLLERQVTALRESVRPEGRWDRLASGEILDGEYVKSCALCNIANEDEANDCGESCPVCPLTLAGEDCNDTKSIYDRWEEAHYGPPRGVSVAHNAPAVVALAREMKALLERLLGEYEARLLAERNEAVADIAALAIPPHLHSVDIGDTITGREHCGDRVPGPEDIPDKTGVSARERAVDDSWTCSHCGGRDAPIPPERRAEFAAHDALIATLEEMHDVGVETAPLVVKAYREWRALHDAT